MSTIRRGVATICLPLLARVTIAVHHANCAVVFGSKTCFYQPIIYISVATAAGWKLEAAFFDEVRSLVKAGLVSSTRECDVTKNCVQVRVTPEQRSLCWYSSLPPCSCLDRTGKAAFEFYAYDTFKNCL